jgi:lysozyme
MMDINQASSAQQRVKGQSREYLAALPFFLMGELPVNAKIRDRKSKATGGLILTFLLFVTSGVSEEAKQPLSNEPSRNDLAEYAASLEPPTRALPYKFRFPEDVRADKAFGIDVSHYEEDIEWEKVARQGIRFVYIKATQGEKYYDPTFKRNWAAVGMIEAKDDPSLHRGAYHFMTAKDPPDLQAQNFLRTVEKLEVDDLPPCLDLEWDWLIENRDYVRDRKGQKIDNWSRFSQEEIIKRVTTWLRIVENATGKKPIIYTTSSWWSNRIGSNSSLSRYSFWIADYTSKSLGQEDPNVPERLSWSFWQLTDQGILSRGGIKKKVDTTVFRGDVAALNKSFGLK